MGELADEQGEENERLIPAIMRPPRDPLAHMNGGRDPNPDPIGYREEHADFIVDFDVPVRWTGHDQGMRHFFEKA